MGTTALCQRWKRLSRSQRALQSLAAATGRPPEPGPPLSRALHITSPCPDEEEQGGRMVQAARTLSSRRALKTEGRVRSSGAAADWTCHECVCCP